MMTQQLGFSVITAPIAAIDRRALSQAWYSALHLARKKPPSHRTLSTVRAESSTAPGRAEQRTHPIPGSPRRIPDRGAPSRAPSQIRETEAERRALRSPLARKIEYTFLHPARRIERATFTVEGATRVHITLQTTDAGLRLIAVCPKRVAERVARALDEARYALAARGIDIAARIVEHAAC